ncbi:MAG: hypothetical protein IJ424_04855 [Oscillospiraceae bacterium]|nr:hypothetical protein [Oscillospiraceae bacterium]
MKKLFALLVAAMLVMAMSVTAFAATASIITDAAKETQAEVSNIMFNLPEGVAFENGDVVTVHIKGTADNTTVRIYLTDAVDVGRVTDVTMIDVVDGAFDVTVDVTLDTSGAFGGTAAPTVLILKGPDWQTPLSNITVEVVEITSDKITEAAEEAPVEEAPVEEETTEEAPVEEDTTEEAPVEEETEAPATGLAFAVVPAVVALAAVVVSKKR